MAVAGDDVELVGRDTLQDGEPVGVRRHLQQRRDFQLAGQLGVGDVVGPRAQQGRALDPQQEVGLTTPGTVVERGLVDDVHAAPHRLHRLGLPLGLADLPGRGRDRDDRQVTLAQRLQVGVLVRQPEPEDQLQHVVSRRRRRGAVEREQVQRGDVRTAEVLGEVGGAQDEVVGDPLHPQTIPYRTDVSRLTTSTASGRWTAPRGTRPAAS